MSFLNVCFGVRNFKEKKLEIFSKHNLCLCISTLLASHITHCFYTFIWLSVLSFIEVVFHLEGADQTNKKWEKKRNKIKNNNSGSASMFSLLYYSSCSPTQI